MLVVYHGRSTEGRYVRIQPDYEIFAPHGSPVELPDEVAARLLESDEWSTPKPTKAPKE